MKAIKEVYISNEMETNENIGKTIPLKYLIFTIEKNTNQMSQVFFYWNCKLIVIYFIRS